MTKGPHYINALSRVHVCDGVCVCLRVCVPACVLLPPTEAPVVNCQLILGLTVFDGLDGREIRLQTTAEK